MTDSLATAKQLLRDQVRAGMKQLSAGARTGAAAAICARLQTTAIWQAAQSVLMFAPLADEPDIWPLVGEALATGKQVALPRYVPGPNVYVARRIRDLDRDVVVGKFEVREPAASCAEIPLNQLDLVLVPGLAFDARGRRLGRGKGFYDRLLADVRGSKCGVAFDEQIVANVPVGPLDIPLNCILTPTRWIET
jgi:5-formyltetrahydrofolate cyclo-ligase